MIKILIVEDDETLLDLEVSLLEMMLSSSASLFTAANGKLALEMCQKEKFDLVLTDIDMPIMTGDQFIDQVKLTNPDNVSKFYILTGFVKNLETLKDKADKIFQKPINIDSIVNSIHMDFKTQL
jgi:two-component system response regulator (stage 0 sporulation protein F)